MATARIRATFWGLLCAFLCADGAHAQPQRTTLVREIQQITNRDRTANAWWGIFAVDLASDEIIYSENAGRSFIPASGTKLYTTAAALDQLGPHYTFRTQLFADGSMADGTLNGNLVVRGTGDPTLGGAKLFEPRTAVFAQWAEILRAAGITHITGDIIGDDDVFDDTALGNSWAWDDEVYGYSAQISGLSFHDNVVDVTIEAQARGEAGIVAWEPHATSYVTIQNSTRTIGRGQALIEGYDRTRGTNIIRLYSEVPEGRTDRESLAVHNPTLYAAHVLREVLVEQGISVGGIAVDVDDLSIKPSYAALRLMANHDSPRLESIVSIVNKESQNLYAELLLRTLGAQHPVEDDVLPPGSAAMGIAAAARTFAAAAIDTSRLQLVDGSGLSRKNLVTPAMTVKLLQFMANHEDPLVRAAYAQSLAVGGRDGTLEYRFRSGVDVRAKTGSLGNVSSLSGYLRTASGRMLAFAVVCNHYTVPTREVRLAIDRIVTVLSQRL